MVMKDSLWESIYDMHLDMCARLCAQNFLQVVGTILSNQELIISSRLGIPNRNIMYTATHARSFSHTHVSSCSVDNFGP